MSEELKPHPGLKPCPFCGEARIYLNAPNPDDGHRFGSINCPACLAVMPGEASSQDELISCWNERVVPAEGVQSNVSDFLNAVYDAIGELETDKDGNVRWSALVNIQRGIGQKAAEFRSPAANKIQDSDGGSRKLPFDPADAAGVNTGTVCEKTGKQEGRTGSEVGASQTPGSSMSFGSDKPIIAGQALGPSECLSQPGSDVKDLALATANHGLADLFAEVEQLRAQVEQAARIADPWPGYPTAEPNAWGTKLTETDKAVIAVRKEIAERIRSLTSTVLPSAEGGK